MITQSVLSDESPLKRLPDGLDQRQRMLIDGIRYSIGMAELAYIRLQAMLFYISAQGNTSSANFASVFADVWLIVDAVSRLRRLVNALPGGDTHETTQLFCRDTDILRLLRNRVQHMDERVADLVNLQEPAWGYITWVSFLNVSSNELPQSGKTHVLASGSMRNVAFNFENPAGKEITASIDLLSLHAYGFSVGISEIMIKVQALTKFLEEQLQKQFEGHPTSMADVYFGLAFNLGPPDEVD
jgi:hypothetical protein